MGRDKWDQIATGTDVANYSASDSGGGLNEHGVDGPYEGARTMAEFLRNTASIVEALAKGFAVLCLLVGTGLAVTQGSQGVVAGVMMIVPAVIIWFIAKPIAIIYRGLGDLTDAHLDLVIKSCREPGQ
jgi:hypothetical protein